MRRSALLVELWECVIFSFQQAGILLPWAEIGQYQTVRDGWEEWRSLDIGGSSRIESLL